MFEFLRRDLLLILLVVAVFLSLSYAIGSKHAPSTGEVQTKFRSGEPAPKSQAVAGRVWRKPTFERVLTLNPTVVTKPTIMRVDDTGNIYILDWADFQIKMFSPHGSLLQVFGEGKGTAGAFVNPSSFSVGARGELWVCDPPQQKITHFSSGGRTQTLVTQREAWRIASVGDALITIAAPERNALFEVYDLSGEYSTSFGELLEDQSEIGIVLDGNIVGDADNQGFIYGGRHLGVIAGYSEDGERRFLVQTIDGLPLPKVLKIGDSQRVKPGSSRAVLSMSVLGNELYVLSGVRDVDAKGTGRQVMDVYDKRNGNYLFSFKLPIACTEAIVRTDYIYTLGDGAVSVLRFDASTLARS